MLHKPFWLPSFFPQRAARRETPLTLFPPPAAPRAILRLTSISLVNGSIFAVAKPMAPSFEGSRTRGAPHTTDAPAKWRTMTALANP